MTPEAFLFWMLCFLFFLAGLRIGTGKEIRQIQKKEVIDNQKFYRIVIAIVGIGIIGAVLIFVDRYMIRGVTAGANLLQNREMLVDSQASSFSALAALTSSIGLFSLIVVWIAETNKVILGKAIKTIALINVLAIVYMSTQLGSRSLLLVIVLIHLFSWKYTSPKDKLPLKIKNKVIIILSISLLAVVSALMMINRVELMGFSMQESVVNSTYAFNIIRTYGLREIFDTNSLGELLAGIFSLVQYIFHGIYEFNLLFTNFQGEHELGARTLWLPLKIISVFTNGWLSINPGYNYGERVGIFTTFVGPIFIDFGWLSPIALFFYGAIFGLPYRLLRNGHESWLPASILIASGMILWPIVNIFISASGTYLLVASIFIGKLMNFRLEN